MAKCNRILTLLQIIAANPYISSEALARLCGISERGVYRYIKNLQDAGIPILHNSHGYHIRQSRRTDRSPEHLEMVREIITLGMAQCEDENVLRAGNREIRSLDSMLGQLSSAGIVVGHGVKPSPLEPLKTHDTIAMDIMALVYSSLIRVDSRGDATPCLAETWERDGDWWRFHLRDAIFASGENISASHVAETYLKARDSHLLDSYRAIEDIAVNDQSIAFRIGGEPSTHIFTLPVSDGTESGRYRVLGWGEEVILEANESYFGPQPMHPAIIFRYFQNQGEVIDAISNREIDIALDLVASDMLMFGNRKFHIFPIDDGKYYTLFFNVGSVEKPVRQALRMMVDKKAIMKNQLKGKGDYCNSPFRQEYASKKVPMHDHAPEDALGLLKSQGWRRDGSGWLCKDGCRLTLRLRLLEHTDIVRRISIALKAQLGSCGIELSNVDEGGDAMLGLCCYGCSPMHGREVWHSLGHTNFSNYANPKTDALWEIGEFSRIHEAVYEDCPAVFIATSTTYVGSCALLPEWVESVSDLFEMMGRPGEAGKGNVNLAAIV